MGNQRHGRKSRAASPKRKRGESTDQSELSDLNDILENISKNSNKVESAVNVILKHEALRHLITKAIKSELSSELTPLQNQIDYLKIKLDDQEQYSRRTNLKISGIKEQGRDENTDDLVLDVINNLILKHQGVALNYSQIGRTHRVGPPPTTSTKNRPRDIIIRFISYRDRDLVFRNKKNLKSVNERQSPDRRLYVNEALTQRRASLYKKTRDLFRNKKIKNCWTHDGKILVKSLAEKTVQITDEKDLEQFLKITVVQDPNTSYVKPSYKDALSNNSVLNASAATFVSHGSRDKLITSTPMQTTNQSKNIHS